MTTNQKVGRLNPCGRMRMMNGRATHRGTIGKDAALQEPEFPEDELPSLCRFTT